jgi:hypothetical protein
MTVQTQAYTVDGFCEAHNVPKSTYYELKKRGQAPREMQVGRRRLISAEAAAEWRRRMEAESAETAA